MNLNCLEWSYIMDWAVLCSCVVLIAGVIVDIVKSIKEKHNLSDEHKLLNKEHQDIKNQVIESKYFIKEQVKNTTDVFESKSSQIYGIVNNLDKTIYGEIQKNNIYQSNLTETQCDIKKYIESINALMKETERLQTLSKNQETEIKQLQYENSKLKEELIHYQKQTHNMHL